MGYHLHAMRGVRAAIAGGGRKGGGWGAWQRACGASGQAGWPGLSPYLVLRPSLPPLSLPSLPAPTLPRLPRPPPPALSAVAGVTSALAPPPVAPRLNMPPPLTEHQKTIAHNHGEERREDRLDADRVEKRRHELHPVFAVRA